MLGKMIECKNVTFKYDNGEDTDIKLALDDVTLDVQKGEFLAILGRNGSGKSTIAKHMNKINSMI